MVRWLINNPAVADLARHINVAIITKCKLRQIGLIV